MPNGFLGIISIVWFCFSINLSAQDTNVDSLKAIINSKQHDTIRLNATEALANFYNNSNTDSTIIFAKKMLQLSRKNNLKKREVRALNRLGGAYEKHSGIEPDSIIAVFEEALVIAEEIDYVELKTHLLNNIGVINLNKGEYDKTIKFCLEALDIAKKNKFDVSILQSLNLISAVFYYQKEYQKSIKYAKQGLANARRVNHPQYIANFTNNIGSFYEEMGKVDSTLIYYEQSLEVTKKNNLDVFTTLTLINIGIIHKGKGHFELANKYALEAYALAQKSNYSHGLAQSLSSLAEIAYDKKQYHKAIKYAKEGLTYVKKQAAKKNIYDLLKKYYIKIGDYKSALEAMENYSAIQDSIFNVESKQQIEELTTKYEVTQKEAENQLLKEKQKAAQRTIRYRNYMALGLAFALLLAIGWGITFYRSNQQKKRYNEILEKRVLERTAALNTANQNLTQSNKELEQANYELRTFNYIASHDIKEPIRVIGGYAGLIFRKLPKDLKESLGEYFDTIKRSTSQLYTLIEDFAYYSTLSQDDKIESQPVDLNLLTYNVIDSLQATIVRYNGEVLVDYLPSINSNNSLLFTALKNLIENGLKYNESENPIVKVDYSKTEMYHQITVSDNGIGIDKKYHDQIFEMFKRLHNRGAYEGSGIGLAIVKLVTEKLGGTVRIESEIDKGTNFVICLPK